MTAGRLGQSLRCQAKARRHRQLVVLNGSPAWGRSIARQLCGNEDAIALTTAKPAPPGWLTPQLVRRLLGREIAHCIVDTHTGIDPDSVGIVGGAIQSGGLLCFLKPATAEGHTVTPYLARFWRLLATQAGAIQIVEGQPLPALTGVAIQADEDMPRRPEDIARPATADQAGAVEGIVAVATGQRRRPTLLIADRGRGKSAALGLAAGRLLVAGAEPIVVTGSSRGAADAVFRHAEAVSTASARLLIWRDTAALLTQQIPCQVLLIDEAAALPLHILEQLLARYPRVAMATTIHGYEGSGRGFLLRFDAMLAQHSRGFRRIEIRSPVRWADDDPVEPAINKLLVLDAGLPEPDAGLATANLRTTVELVDRHRLAASETLIADLFSLLVLSHYKTRPNDLQVMLDNPRLRIYRVCRLEAGNAQKPGDAPANLGVALVVEEGGLNEELGLAMATGTRRPAGQVLPALLAIHGQADAVTQRMQRIMRIVIHPTMQRQGLGSQLLQHIVSDNAGRALTGSNFALSAPLLQFWQRNGFALLQIGQRRTVQSGRHNGTVLRSGDAPSARLISRMTGSLIANLPRLLASSLRDLETPTVLAILSGLHHGYKRPSGRTLKEVEDVAFGARDPQNVPAALSEAALHGLCNSALSDPALAVQRLLQQRSWKQCDCLGGAVGWREGNRQIRKLFAEYLARLGDIGT